MRLLRLVVIFQFMILTCRAGSVVGGELFYDFLGGSNYSVTLKLYRDCSGVSAPFDNPAKVCVYDASGAFVDSLLLPFPGSVNVPPSINNPCFTPPPGICVDVAIYSGNINLPPKTGGYYLVYQRCCRSNSVLNITNPANTGSSYMEHIPGPEVVSTNSSPRFNVNPPIFTCAGSDVAFNYTASDPDGDSLVYDFCSPFTGLDACCPLLVSSAPVAGCVNPPSSGVCPAVGSAPPYNYVLYVSPYSGSYPMSSNPSVQINAQTGHISGTPNITGQWTVGVCVKEYRNGVLLGTHLRDFQFSVINCPNLILSSILPQSQKCNGLSITFANLSSGGTGYTWNFGDPTTLADTSNLQNPTYTFPDTGKYVITLINHGPAPACNDTSTQIFYVYPTLNPSFVAPSPQCIVGNSFNFNAGGQYATYSSFNWNFTTAATPSSSAQQNPTGVTFNQYGNFPVSLTVTEKGCFKTVTDTVKVYPNTVAQFQIDSAKGCQPLSVTFTNTSVYGTSPTYLWNFGDGNTSNAQNPTHVFQNPGTFDISLAVTTTVGCVGTSSVNVNALVTVYPGPKAGFEASPLHTNIYYPDITFTDTSKNVTVQVVTMGDGTVLSSLPPKYTYTGFGYYTIMQIAESSNGCSDTARQTIFIDPDHTFYVPNTFTPNGDIHNEEFGVKAFGIGDFSMFIYDRWGREVFSTTDIEKGWDGTYKGKKCPEDVYVYKIEYTPLSDPYPRKVTGRIYLMR